MAILSDENSKSAKDILDKSSANPIAASAVDESSADVLMEALSKFTYIEENEYYADGLAIETEFMPCNCADTPQDRNKPQSARSSDISPSLEPLSDTDNEANCGENCLNRMMFIECIDKNCSVGEKCTNRKFQRKENSPFELFRTEGKGYGARATADIPANSFIIEYTGEVLPISTFVKRTKIYESEGYTHFYVMTLKQDEVIDATKRAGIARFFNHSCNPNCVLQKWVVGKQLRIGIFSKKFIAKGQEMCFDYKFERYGAEPQKCLCGEPNCKGTIGVSKGIDSPEQSSVDSLENELESVELSDDDTEQLPAGRGISIVKGIEDVEKIGEFISHAMISSDNSKKLVKAIDKLLATESMVCMRRFLNLRGLFLLRSWLKSMTKDPIIVKKILNLCTKLPINTRNTIEKSNIEPVLEGLTSSNDIVIEALSRKLLKDWGTLKPVYTIPKRSREDSSSSSAENSENLGAPTKKSHTSREPRTMGSPRGKMGFSASSQDQHRGNESKNGESPQLNIPPEWMVAYDSGGRYFINRTNGRTSRDIAFIRNSDKRRQDTQKPLIEREPEIPKANPADSLYGVPKTAIDKIIETARQKTLEEENARKKEEEKLKKKLAHKQKLKAKLKEEVLRRKKFSSSSVEPSDSSPNPDNTSGKDPEVSSPKAMAKELREDFSALVIKYFSRYKDNLSNEKFKKHARKITHSVIEKEMRGKESPVGLTDEVKKKIKKFVESYAGKLTEKSSESSRK